MAPHSGGPDSHGHNSESSVGVISFDNLNNPRRNLFHFTNEETGYEAAQQVPLTSKWQSSNSTAWALTTRTTTSDSCPLSASDYVGQDVSFPRSRLYPAWTLSLPPCFNYTPRPGSWGYSSLTLKDTYLVRRLPGARNKLMTLDNR